jgi:excisionase family DNA binding protein
MIAQIEFPTFLTLAEAAAILRVHRATVGRMVDAGEIPATRVRGLPRINAADLAAWIGAGGSCSLLPPKVPVILGRRGRPKKTGLKRRAAV